MHTCSYYCMSKKSWTISYSKLLYEMGQDLLELWYGSIELHKKTGLISINWVPTY